MIETINDLLNNDYDVIITTPYRKVHELDKNISYFYNGTDSYIRLFHNKSTKYTTVLLFYRDINDKTNSPILGIQQNQITEEIVSFILENIQLNNFQQWL